MCVCVSRVQSKCPPLVRPSCRAHDDITPFWEQTAVPGGGLEVTTSPTAPPRLRESLGTSRAEDTRSDQPGNWSGSRRTRVSPESPNALAGLPYLIIHHTALHVGRQGSLLKHASLCWTDCSDGAWRWGWCSVVWQSHVLGHQGSPRWTNTQGLVQPCFWFLRH